MTRTRISKRLIPIRDESLVSLSKKGYEAEELSQVFNLDIKNVYHILKKVKISKK